MQVIPPVPMLDANLTSSTVPEDVAATYAGGTTYDTGDRAGAAPVAGSAQVVYESIQDSNTANALSDTDWWKPVGSVYPTYDGGTSYALGDIVSSVSTDVHSLYESLAASNSGNALTDTTKWQYIGKTNRWKMFDYTRNAKTSVPLTFTVVFAPGKRVNSIALAGVVANSYSISVSSSTGGGVVYAASGNLSTRETTTWSDYFFGEFDTMPSVVFFDIPPYSDCVFTVTLTATSGNVELGALVVGTYIYLGATQYTASSDVLNFSTIERDIDGNAILTQRRNVPKLRQTVLCDKSNVNKARMAREDLNATPAIWYGIDDSTDGYFESLAILGIYKGFEINIGLPEKAELSIELEEV